jgi:AraC family transcriptional regulator
MSVAFLPNFETYGSEVCKRAFGGFALSLGSHRANETIPAHRHADEHAWCVTLGGSFEEHAGSRRETSSAGSVLIRPPDCVHSDRFSGIAALCLNLFPSEAWLVANDLTGLRDTFLHQRSPRLLTLGREVARELEQTDDAAPLAVESLLLELLARTARLDGLSRSGFARWFAIALDEIEANPAGELKLSELARHCGVSAGHLARSFRATFGKPLGAYVRERRLERASEMIRTSKCSLAEVAAAVGFCDQAHFSRAFKARFKLTPATYGKQLRS